MIAHDRAVMARANRWVPPRWFRLWMIAATRGGDGWIWYGAGVLVAVEGGVRRFHALAAAALAVACGVGLFVTLKRTCKRRRPMGTHSWATLREPDRFSFPSGHTVTAFAVAGSLSVFYHAEAFTLFFLAASVGASRVILGLHFLNDVLAGALLGLALGVAAAKL